jgi:pimeloyl-ACP methyl ester carboxylesterase
MPTAYTSALICAGLACGSESGGGCHLLVVVLCAAFAFGCGGDQRQANGGDGAKTRRGAPVTVGPGRLVGIGEGRRLYMDCVGSGRPTVVLEAGFGGDSLIWQHVQSQLGRTAQTCAYDRAGLGSSVAIPGVHDAGDEIDDLQRLLDHAQIAPPYVLVGHSYGGLLVRVFADAHPSETAGMVLVDSMGRNQDRRLLRIWQAQPPRLRRVLTKPGAKPVEDGVDVRASQALAAKVSTLGDTPLAVITRGRPDETVQVPPTVRKPFDRLWARMQDELAALSSDHVHVVALRSGHFVQHPDIGQPNVVIRAVRAVVHAARTGTHLPPCPRVFSGSGTRCRS